MGGDSKRKWVIINGWIISMCWVHGDHIVQLWFLIFGPSSSLRQVVIECLIKVCWGGHGVVWSDTAQPCGYGGRLGSRCFSKLCEAGKPLGTGISKKQETGIKKQFFPQDWQTEMVLIQWLIEYYHTGRQNDLVLVETQLPIIGDSLSWNLPEGERETMAHLTYTHTQPHIQKQRGKQEEKERNRRNRKQCGVIKTVPAESIDIILEFFLHRVGKQTKKESNIPLYGVQMKIWKYILLPST